MNTDKQWARILAVILLASASGGSSSATIGEPFRISESVKTYCAMKPPAMMCEVFSPQLAEFMAETRDGAWAGPVEMLIEKSMRVKDKRWVEIRALECRRTLCALEYAVPVDDMGQDVDGSEELERLMDPVGGVVAPELPTGPGKGKLVSVLIWRKR